jgi:HEAT repeat protein
MALPDRDTLEEMRAALRSDDPAIRAGAMEQLGDLLSDSVRAIVAEAMASENPEVREAAERLLVRIAEVTASEAEDAEEAAPEVASPGAPE